MIENQAPGDTIWTMQTAKTWWIGSYLEVFDPETADGTESVQANENYILLAAASFEEAYAKLIRHKDIPDPVGIWHGRNGRWRFLGITLLLPVEEELEDGAELLWKRWEGYSEKDLLAWIQTREELMNQAVKGTKDQN